MDDDSVINPNGTQNVANLTPETGIGNQTNHLSTNRDQYLSGASGQEKVIVSKNHILNQERNYHTLPTSFEVPESVSGAISLLRKKMQSENVEDGGVLMTDKEENITFSHVGRKGDFFVLSAVNITDANIDVYMRMLQNLNPKGEDFLPFFDAVTAPKQLADTQQPFFHTLVQKGVKLYMDKIIISIIHSHPSGNLPSIGDFTQAATANFEGSKYPEIVVTNEYSYFLLPTNQTPDLTEVLVKSGERERLTETEDLTVKRLQESSGKGEKGITNAIRHRFLQENCTKYNLGFYAMESGKPTAQRVF